MDHKILIFGTSAWLTGITESLNTIGGLNAQCLNPRLVRTTQQITALAPDVIIVERGLWDWTLLLRLPPDFPVIELDAARSVLWVRDIREIMVQNLEDLVCVIRKVTDSEIDMER